MPRYEDMSHPRRVAAESARFGREDLAYGLSRRSPSEPRRGPVDDWLADATPDPIGPSRRRARPVHDWLSETSSRSGSEQQRRAKRDHRLDHLDWDAPEDWDAGTDWDAPERGLATADWDAPEDWDATEDRRAETDWGLSGDWSAAADRVSSAGWDAPTERDAPRRAPTGTGMIPAPTLIPTGSAGSVPARRTIRISGRGAEGARGYERAMRARTSAHRGPKPDRVAMWAVLLGIALAIGAATSSHAAVLATHLAQLAPH